MPHALLEISVFESTIMPLVGLASIIAIIAVIVIAVKNKMKSQDQKDKEALAKQKAVYSKYWVKNLPAIKAGFKKYYASQIVDKWNTLDDFEDFVYAYDEQCPICIKCGEKLEWGKPEYVNDTGYYGSSQVDTGIRLKDEFGNSVSVYKESGGGSYPRRYQVRYASCPKCKFWHFKQNNLHHDTTGAWNTPTRQSSTFVWLNPEMEQILGHDFYQYLSDRKPSI